VPLDRKRVADTALNLLNEVGLERLTLSAIGCELGVKAPALYWHFKNKQALIDEMATEMYRRMASGTPLDPADTWQERLRKSSHGLRGALRGYRDGAKVFSGSRFTGIEHAEQMEDNLRLLVAAGFTLAQAVRATMTAYLYTTGFVTEEQSVGPPPGTGGTGGTGDTGGAEAVDITERARMMADFPLSAAAGAEIFADYDQHFEDGLELVIAGIAARYGIG
jgi:TetR/AcrR family transcriptional regulator, tetracycline repressor protein